MSTPARLVLLAKMQGRDLLRRRSAIGLLMALPLLFYFSQLPDGQTLDALVSGGVGTAWVTAGAALFAALAARDVDPRLVLAGYRPWEILTGRLILLDVVALVLAAVFTAVMLGLSSPPEPLALIAALASTVVVAVPLGLLIAGILPKELEATMVLIGVVGIQMAIQPPSVFLPLYGALELMQTAAAGSGPMTGPLLHAFLLAPACMGIALLLWARRLPKPVTR